MTIRIVIADDHAVVREGVRRILDREPDLEVAGEAASGDEALALACAGNCDVILLDLSMPGRRGIELIKLIKDRRPDARILVLSMHSERQYAVRAIRAGAAGYLTKAGASGEMVDAIRRVAAGGVFITAPVAERLAIELQPRSEEAPHKCLSDREYEVFLALVAGDSVSDIAHRLFISVKTVSTHKARILDKLDMHSVAELVRYAMSHGLVDRHVLD